MTAHASWLVCEEECVPESATLRLALPVESRPGSADPAVAALLGSARQRLPQGFSGEVSLALADEETLRLTLGREGLPSSVRSAWYFPVSWGLIEHAADQALQVTADRLSLDLTPGPRAAGVEPGGVIVVETETGARAFRLDPSPSLVAGPANRAGQALGLPLALGFALVGGLLLNLMPCVFPVLAMKVMSLAGHGGLEGRGRALQGLAYTAGVLVFFALVAGLLLVLRSAGARVGWGYQLQYPPFVVMMAYLFFLLGLSLAGAVTLGSRLMGLGAIGPSAGIRGAFFTGALAALVAAPCTAPLMGAALGYAVTLSWPLAVSIILVLGLGLALPFLVLALVPGSERFLPRPGPWMESLKQFLAFPMFATTAWLVWVLSIQTGPAGVAAALAGLIAVALAVWAWERSRRGASGWHLAGRLVAAAGLAVALLLAVGLGRDGPGGVETLTAASGKGLRAQVFSAESLERARSEGHAVLVNMTAAWCITCLVNERVALSSTTVADAFAANEVHYLKGDWTNRDPQITDYLAAFGRNGVPLYVYYPAGGEPEVLPQILTESLVLGVLGGERTRRD
jgi:thiol:disulfide interchange protein DsbD